MRQVTGNPMQALQKHLLAVLFCCSSMIFSQEISVVYTHESATEFARLFNQFEKETGIKVNAKWIDQSELKSRLIKILAMKDVPDVLIQPSDNIGMVEFASFSEVSQDLLNPELRQETLDAVTLNGNVYGIPIIQGNHLLLYYHKGMIQEPAENWQELIEQEKLVGKGQLIHWSFMEMYWFVPFLLSFGEPPLVDDMPNLDTPGMRAALKYVWGLSRENVLDRRCNYTCSEQRFIRKESAYLINGIWSYQTLKQPLGNELGVALLPKINGKPMRSFSSSIVAAFPNRSLHGPKREALEAFAKFLQGELFQKSLWRDLGELPSNQKVLTELKKEAHPDYRVILEGLEQSVAMSSHKNMAIVWEAILKGFTRYGSGTWTLDRATSYMQRVAERALQSEQLE